MSKLDLSKISVDTFCDLNGVKQTDRLLMNKIHKGKINSYSAWHTLLSKNFKLHPKKDFTPKVAVKEEIKKETSTPKQPIQNQSIKK